MGRHWTKDDKATIKKLFEEGNAYSTIAEEYGVTRNTIAGLINRMGLRRPKGAKPVKPKKSTKRRVVQKNIKPPKKRFIFNDGKRTEPFSHVPSEEQKYNIKTINDLTHEGINILDDKLTRSCCRAVMSGTGSSTMFCGLKVHEGSFCKVHAKAYYNKIR